MANADLTSADLNRARAAALDSFVDTMNKDHPGSAMILGQETGLDVDVIPTGAISLDVALGVGGFPRGRIIELYGPQMSGKTSLALSTGAQAQRAGGTVGVVDVEYALSPAHAENMGLDLSRTVIAQPEGGDEALNMVAKMCESGAFDVVVLDSVAALIPASELEGELGDNNRLGAHAQMLSRGLRKLTPIVARSKAVAIFVNQIRMNPTAYGNPETTTGGRALGFYSSVRVEVRSSASKRITGRGGAADVIGQTTTFKITKNKVAPPYRTGTYELYFDSGIAQELSLVEVAERCGVLARAGASYTEVSTGERLAVGKESLRQLLVEDRDTFGRLYRAVYETLGLPVPALDS